MTALLLLDTAKQKRIWRFEKWFQWSLCALKRAIRRITGLPSSSLRRRDSTAPPTSVSPAVWIDLWKSSELLVASFSQSIITLKTILPRSTQSAARSPQHASRSTQHGYFNSYFRGSMNTTMRIASYLLYCLQCESTWKLEKFQLSCGLRAADCGLRACMNRTMGIHSVNFSCVLRTACCVEVWIGLYSHYRVLLN